MSGPRRTADPGDSPLLSWIEASILLMLLLGLTVALALDAFASRTGAEANRDVVETSALEARGLELYGRCLACHAIETDRVGPRHCGLFGRSAGSVSGFGYSEAMRKSGIVWGRETLDRFLSDPLGVVPGTLMTYAGVPDPRERAILIAWLERSTAPERCRPVDS